MSQNHPSFVAMITNASILDIGLRGLATGKRDQHVVCEINSNGIRFITTDSSKASQGYMAIPEDLFDEWYIVSKQSDIKAESDESQATSNSKRMKENNNNNSSNSSHAASDDDVVEAKKQEDGDMDVKEEQSNTQGLFASSIIFRINLAVLLDCLNCAGNSNLANTTLRLAFIDDPDSGEQCFCLSMLEGEVITECKIRTIIDEDGSLHAYAQNGEGNNVSSISNTPDFIAAFKLVPGQLNKAILSSEHLREALAEISEFPGAATVRMLMSPSAPYFRLSTHGQSGSCEIDFPQGDESFVQFICHERYEFDYRLSLLKQAGKVLHHAKKTYLRMNAEGMLSIQHMIEHPSGKKSYVDYFVLADVTFQDQDSTEAGSESGQDSSAMNDSDRYQQSREGNGEEEEEETPGNNEENGREIRSHINLINKHSNSNSNSNVEVVDDDDDDDL